MTFTYETNKISYVMDGEELAWITFPSNESGTVWDINHTFVDPSLRGQGIANQLLAEVVRLATEQQVGLKPTCPFAIKVFAHTPEYQVLEVKEF